MNLMTSKNFINENNETIHVSIKYVGNKANELAGFHAHQHNVVLIKNMTTKKSTKVDFWGSQVEPNQESEQGLKNALECICMDISAADSASNFTDFCYEFGYDTDSISAEKTYKGCLSERDRVMKVLSNDYHVLDNFNTWINS